MIKRLLISALAIGVIVPSLAFAEGSTDYSTGNGINISNGIDLSRKMSKNKNHTDSRSKTNSSTAADDEQISNSLKEMHDARRSREFDISKPAQTVFIDFLIELEQNPDMLANVPKQGLVEAIKMQILSNPKLLSDFGLGSKITEYAIDATRAEFLAKSAGTNGNIAALTDEEPIREYIQALAIYGAIVGQSYIYLNEEIGKLDNALHTTGKKGRITKGVRDIKVEAVGSADFDILARSALYKVFQTGITDTMLKRTMERALNNKSQCRFAKSGDMDGIACGEIKLRLDSPPELLIAGVQWAGSSFAGYQGSYKMSSSWSYSQTLDKLQSVSQSSRIAVEYAKRAEDAESKGKGAEAVIAIKQGVDVSSKTNNSVKPTWKGNGLR